MALLGPRLASIPGIKSQTWRTLPLQSRLAALQDVSDTVADFYGIDHVHLKTRKGGLLLRGSYDRKETIAVGANIVDLKSPRPAISIVLHETRHAVQQTYLTEPQTFQQKLWAINERVYVGALPMLIGAGSSWSAGAFKPLIAKASFLAPIGAKVAAVVSHLALAVWAGYRLQPQEVDAFGFQHAARGTIREVTGGRRYQLPCRVRDAAIFAAIVGVSVVSQAAIIRHFNHQSPVVIHKTPEVIHLEQDVTTSDSPRRETVTVVNRGKKTEQVDAIWSFAKTVSDARGFADLARFEGLPPGTRRRYSDKELGILHANVKLRPQQTATFRLRGAYPHGCTTAGLSGTVLPDVTCW